MNCYSWRNAAIGSIRDALRAGKYAASNPATPSSRTELPMIPGSAGFKPNNIDATHRDAAQAIGSPAAIPTTTSRTAPLTTMTISRVRFAPNAMRMPISLVRRATLYAINPYSPMQANSNASILKPLARVAIMRSCTIAASNLRRKRANLYWNVG
jgi:hypothetical protein